jgi:signal transduction histidine kinase
MARGLKASAPDAFKGQLAELESLAGGILREMRLLLDQLRNVPAEETIDLAEAIQAQCQALAQKTGPEGGPLLAVETELPACLVLPSSVADAALWVVREALQNIVRHSGCRAARIEVSRGTQLYVTIRDEGAGFDVNATPAGHYGLRGMRERVLALGGEFRLDSELGRGTMLTFSLPIPR